jgi:hypothetical protein
VTFEVQPRGSEQVPGGAVVLPNVVFDPDPMIEYEPTGKRVPGSALMTDLLRMGIYWNPGVISGGDWGMGTMETHSMADPRSFYLAQLRSDIQRNIGNIGYDRFEHFGLMYAWGRLPDYGAGALLNRPPANAPYDMRALHLNGQWVQTVAQYVLATGDTGLLKARRARWLATDGSETQPLCGKGEHGKPAAPMVADNVLHAGEVRLDGKAPQKVFSLGQGFTAKAPFRKVMLRLGTEGGESPSGVLRLLDKQGGAEIARTDIRLEFRKGDQLVTLDGGRELQPGKYFVELTDNDSGKRYFGPGIFWWTDPDTDHVGGEATAGPFSGTVLDRMRLLLDYMRKYMGAEKENIAYNINDPEYNIPNHKSGRHGVMTEMTFWELGGGGYDMFQSLWYNAGCRALAEMCDAVGDEAAASQAREWARLADEAYNRKYWHTVTENGKQFSRFYGCEDWDGRKHDYGFTYFNLEAANRDIPTTAMVRQILWWLDRGYWTPDGGPVLQYITDWRKHNYSVWQLSTPFNTVGNTTWLNVTGCLPYLEVVTNGGTRLDIPARDLRTRSRYFSVDSMHERNRQILSRYANPDRLTGGRSVEEPGGRGRWHWGNPPNERADIEGYREIFPTNGTLVTAAIASYLGADYRATGLSLRPRVPSELNSMRFEGIGYGGGVFDFSVAAERTDVPTTKTSLAGPMVCAFSATAPFNKAGMQALISPFRNRANCQLSLTLEKKVRGKWEEAASVWYNHVQDKQWVWLTEERWLEPGDYRLRVHDIDTPEGESLTIAADDVGVPAVRLAAERTRLEVRCAHAQPGREFALDGKSASRDKLGLMTAVMEPGDSVVLKPKSR